MKYKVALLQMDIVTGDKAANMKTFDAMAMSAKERGADIAFAPEIFTTGYWFERFDELAEGLDGPCVNGMRERAQSLGIWVGGGFVERNADGGLSNSYAVIDRQGGR